MQHGGGSIAAGAASCIITMPAVQAQARQGPSLLLRRQAAAALQQQSGGGRVPAAVLHALLPGSCIGPAPASALGAAAATWQDTPWSATSHRLLASRAAAPAPKPRLTGDSARRAAKSPPCAVRAAAPAPKPPPLAALLSAGVAPTPVLLCRQEAARQYGEQLPLQALQRRYLPSRSVDDLVKHEAALLLMLSDAAAVAASKRRAGTSADGLPGLGLGSGGNAKAAAAVAAPGHALVSAVCE